MKMLDCAIEHPLRFIPVRTRLGPSFVVDRSCRRFHGHGTAALARRLLLLVLLAPLSGSFVFSRLGLLDDFVFSFAPVAAGVTAFEAAVAAAKLLSAMREIQRVTPSVRIAHAYSIAMLCLTTIVASSFALAVVRLSRLLGSTFFESSRVSFRSF